jgi:N-acetyltransferase
MVHAVRLVSSTSRTVSPLSSATSSAGWDLAICGRTRGGGRTVYAIRLAADSHLGLAGTLVGTSGLSEADLRNESIHLGGTMYGPRWWSTQVNPESKLLLLAHCFEDCGYGRVKIQTDALNSRSQAAIARLGATREGVLRRHMRREDGSFRDTVVYSMLKDEWPETKARLTARLTAEPKLSP